MVGRLMSGQPRQAERNEIKVGGVNDSVERQDRPPRGEGGLSGKDHEGSGNAAKAHAAGMFVEIAKDHRRPGGMPPQRKPDGVKLLAAGGAQQAEVDRHNAQGGRRVEIDDHCAARFVSWQVQPLYPADMDAGAGENCIAMPAKADGIAADGQRGKPGQRGDPVTRQSRGAVAEASVSLLQRDDVGLQCGDSGQHAIRIAAPVGADRLVDVPGRNPKGRL